MTIAFGIVLGLCGSIAINTGNNFQSYGMHLLELENKEDLNLCDSYWWVLGTVIFLAGACLNFASFGFAPQSTLASLGSIQFVCNILFGKWLLEKAITWKMMMGSLLAVGGTILAVFFASKDAAEIKNVQDLVYLWNNWYWIAYLTIGVVLAMVIYFAYNWLEQRETKHDLVILLATMYAVFSAFFGTLSVVFAKLLSKLLELQTQGVNPFTEWYSYITAVSWLVLMVFWLYRLNNALALYSPLLIIPLLQSTFILFSNISGGLYFQEFNYMKPVMWVGFCCGVTIMFIGIFLLVPSMEEDSSDDEFEDPYMRESMLGNRKDMTNFFMTGAGRMHQYQWDMKLQKILNERRLTDLGGKKSLTRIETELVKQLTRSIMDADTYIKCEDELAEHFSGAEPESHKIKDLMIKLVANEKTVKIGNNRVAELKEDLRQERNSLLIEEKTKLALLNSNIQSEPTVEENTPYKQSESNSSVHSTNLEDASDDSVVVLRSLNVN